MKFHNSALYKYQLFLFALCFSLYGVLIGLQCKKPTPPDVDDTPKPGKRDYTWTIDTLAYPGSFQTLMRDIWASSPTNVYVVGHNDQGGQGTMFRYDGNKWRAVDLGSIIIGGISLSAVYGFGPNDIYAVGERIYDNPTPPPNFLDSSLIIRFDGVSWREVKINKKRALYSIHGSNPSSIVAVGHDGTLYYFNGANWRLFNYNSYPIYGEQSFIRVFASDNDKFYINAAWRNLPTNDSTLYSFIKFDGSTISIIDSFYDIRGSGLHQWGVTGIWFSPTQQLYSCGLGVYKYNDSKWNKLISSNTFLSSIYGTSDRNIFVCGQYGKIIHYNGIDWYLYEELQFSNVWFSDIWTDGNEVFIVGSTFDGNKYITIILHGK